MRFNVILHFLNIIIGMIPLALEYRKLRLTVPLDIQSEMTTTPNYGPYVSAIFITFSGNCRSALTYYQTCFGGTLRFEAFEDGLQDYIDMPVVSGSLVSDSIVIHGSDLVHNEGRVLGNYMSIFLQCKTNNDRQALIEKLERTEKNLSTRNDADQKLIEITDVFDVRWLLGIK